MDIDYPTQIAPAVSVRNRMLPAPKGASSLMGDSASPAVKVTLYTLSAVLAVVGVFLAVYFVEIMVAYAQMQFSG